MNGFPPRGFRLYCLPSHIGPSNTEGRTPAWLLPEGMGQLLGPQVGGWGRDGGSPTGDRSLPGADRLMFQLGSV